MAAVPFLIASLLVATTPEKDAEKVKNKQEILFCEEEESSELVLSDEDLVFFDEESQSSDEISSEEE